MKPLAARLTGLTFDALSAPQPEESTTAIERKPFAELTALQQQWRTDGLVILRNFIPAVLRDAYSAARERILPKDRTAPDNYWHGWRYAYPYLACEELKELALHRPLTTVLRELIGDEMGLHLTLTGWISTERNFHQDTYLNPSDLWSYYLAAWIALDDIHADSGPFQFVRGSHTWNVLRREKLFSHLTREERESPMWPTFTQEWVSQACEREIERRGARVEEFVPNGGDVLIWHSNLIHRGSVPRNENLVRKSLIAHYSSIERRSDMHDLRVHTNGSRYFHFPPPSVHPQQLALPKTVAPAAPKRSILRKLLGRE